MATATDAKRQFVFQNPSQNEAEGASTFSPRHTTVKTRLVTLPPLQTKPDGGTTPSLVIGIF